jgi:thiol-disulfide isomerase/thioredoxin
MSRQQRFLGGITILLGLGACGPHRPPAPAPNAPPESAPTKDATPPVPTEKRVPGTETGGIGIALAKQEDHLVIGAILPESPAALNKAIRVGDRVIAVQDEGRPAVALEGKSVVEAVALIRGPRGTALRLTLAPAKDAAQAHVVSLVRGEVKGLSSEGVPLTDVLGWGDGVLLKAGSDAPDIEMVPLHAKQPQRLSDFKGKVVVLTFWATWCAPCQKVMAELQTCSEKHPHWKDKVVLIAASVDEDHEALAKHVAAKGWDKTRHVHVGADAIRAYHVGAVATQYVIDRQGKIVAADHSLEVPRVVNQLVRK